MKIKVGDKAPDFTLPSHVGENITLYFYPSDETPGCTKEACTFRDSFEVFKELGAEVIGVSSDDVESHRSFAEKHGLPFILLSDKKTKSANCTVFPPSWAFFQEE